MPEFDPLPWHENHAGAPRRVGVEMEMAGVDPEQIGAAVTDVLGGRFEAESAFSGTVRETGLGDFGIELDADLLTSRHYLDMLDTVGISIEAGQLRDSLEDVLSRLAGIMVPHELVCPPVNLADLPRIDAIREGLRKAGAKGTHSSALYAFGLQFNVELADDGADHLLAVLRAFLTRFDRICEREQIDFSRKLTPFVQPFPEDFVTHVLDPEYAPDRSTLIDDYLRFTPTRNRPLDLLPILAWIDPDRVRAAPVEHALIKPRPAWHYRLPNALIDDPDWSLARPWKEWAGIEELAANPAVLGDAMRRRWAHSSRFRRWLASARQSVAGWLDRR